MAQSSMSFLTGLKAKWLSKHKLQLRQKVDTAFAKTKRELIDYINAQKTEPDYFIKYLAQCLATDDVITFIKIMKGIIAETEKCKGDPSAKKARVFCNYIIFRIHWLSQFTLKWTNIKIMCNKCKHIQEVNFLYTDKICPVCGNIIL